VILRFCLAVAVLLLAALPGSAHELRPAFLEVREIGADRYEVLWKRPARGDRTLALSVRWPAFCRDAAPGRAESVPGATIERQLIECGPAGLLGQRIAIDGLSGTLTDTLVRIEFLEGTTQTNLVKPAQAWVDINGPRPAGAVAAEYFILGIEHILLGLDHLLFVLGLTLIVRGTVLLVKTITAFTVAHSITLGLATLGYVSLPPAPVEAVIALSILFLASELARQGSGQPGLTERAPWLVAFAFGLLHGFGFAGALSEVGLPQTDIPLALLTFNIGVEAGQLLFVAAVLLLIAAGRQLVQAPPRWLRHAPAYAIGPLAALWLIERMAAFV
jgi:hydrogenase/urease accessory protein HupE